MNELPPDAYVIALLALPELWPTRLAALLGLRRIRRDQQPRPVLFGDEPPVAQRSPADAWALVRSGAIESDPATAPALGVRGDPARLGSLWARAAVTIDVESLWLEHQRAGVTVDLLGSPGYPAALATDPAAPYALFRVGSQRDLEGPYVAIVGTRRCTALGREIALEYGEVLSRAGVRVVSGLALGIDGAAHEGALRAGAGAPIGVVAGGFDRPYPARHRRLWADVSRSGALVSEWPLGTPSERWRFPARNRIIAGLADAVVVVESRRSGGSVITAEEASSRGKAVFAVPGSVRNPAAEGTNRLLRDGAFPACDVGDVLAHLGLRPEPSPTAKRPTPDGRAGEVLAAIGWEPTPMDVILRRCPLGRSVVALDLAHLELDGWIRPGAGGWQRTGVPG